MKKTMAIGLVVVGLAAGALVTVFILDRQRTEVAAPSVARSSSAGNADVEARLWALENQLTEEIGRRNELENIVASLLEADQQPVQAETARPETPPAPVLQRLEELQDPAFREQRQAQIRDRLQQFNGPDARSARLEKSGFSPEQAAWIVEREEEMRLESLYDEWERRRQQTVQRGSNRQSVADKMKSELGVDGYERYLEATGRPTTVSVGQIIDNSPAAKAGFKPGDQIVSYNGERVFNVNELNDATVQGNLGEPVMVGVIRDGQPLQIPMERGPLGVTTGPIRNARVLTRALNSGAGVVEFEINDGNR